MDALNARLDKMMCMLAEERAQQIATEENLCQTQARLDATSSASLSTEPAAAKSFVGKILLHTLTYPEKFPTDSRKLAFAVSFMTDYTATWSQPYLMKVFNAEEVAFNKFLNNFKSSFFDHNCQHRAEVALQSLRQTRTVSAYTQEFNSPTHMLAPKMSNSPWHLEWPTCPHPPASTSAPTTNPNAMDLLAFQRGPHNRFSDTKQAHQVQLKLCFFCDQAGHVSCGCSNGNRTLQGPEIFIFSPYF
ncbi:uncharacterized protein VP01_899g3 [Puccinia sorghi]|uniref:Retrotransposon gag domain-containing protein n=1 Tax=Puccinia sorghi TaxID=27349 RepID=A0A0L6U8I2_9BASI|nr:uncharacterized protein VP01_899g3 [Puccinia sorghi]